METFILFVMLVAMVLTWKREGDDEPASTPSATSTEFLDEEPTSPLPSHSYQTWNTNNAPIDDPRRVCDVPGCGLTRMDHARPVRADLARLTLWMDPCPQIGSGGIHSTDYLDGGECEWCGARASANVTDLFGSGEDEP